LTQIEALKAKNSKLKEATNAKDQLLRQHGLVFLGFTGPVSAAYRARFPADAAMIDLDQWHQFESEKPTAFTGMYQFWVQKA
jgi:hypothetical protein